MDSLNSPRWNNEHAQAGRAVTRAPEMVECDQLVPARQRVTALPRLIDLTAGAEQPRGELDSGDSSNLDHLAVRGLEPVELVFHHLTQVSGQIGIRPAFCRGVEQGAEKQRVSTAAAVQRRHSVRRWWIGSSSDQFGGRLQG